MAPFFSVFNGFAPPRLDGTRGKQRLDEVVYAERADRSISEYKGDLFERKRPELGESVSSNDRAYACIDDQGRSE